MVQLGPVRCTTPIADAQVPMGPMAPIPDGQPPIASAGFWDPCSVATDSALALHGSLRATVIGS